MAAKQSNLDYIIAKWTLEPEYSPTATVAIVLFYALLLIAVVLIPIITGITLGIPDHQLKYSIQGTVLQGDSSLRVPSN